MASSARLRGARSASATSGREMVAIASAGRQRPDVRDGTVSQPRCGTDLRCRRRVPTANDRRRATRGISGAPRPVGPLGARRGRSGGAVPVRPTGLRRGVSPTRSRRTQRSVDAAAELWQRRGYSPAGRVAASGDRRGRSGTQRTSRDPTLAGPRRRGAGHRLLAGREPRGDSQPGRPRHRCRDPETGEPLHGIEAHEGGAWDVAFSPDGRRLASVGDDEVVRIWDAQTRRGDRRAPRRTGHSDVVYSVVFDPDGELLATTAQTGPPSSGTPTTAEVVLPVRRSRRPRLERRVPSRRGAGAPRHGQRRQHRAPLRPVQR